jgi:23S rRNA (cytosine1962-C5)-methyltransferase
MDRARVWTNFDDARILVEDEDIIAIDKPAGMSSQSADPERPDDLVTRLRAHLAASGRGSYLGVHQRLDRETSGVLVMARRRDANAALARQFEGRKVDKHYRACVVGWPKGRAQATLDDLLAPGDGGRMRVVARGARGGLRATTRVKVLERQGDRALLELSLETGRTHQARVQLAHAGAPIAGDALYGGAPAPRLMLHASSLALLHPRSGKRERYEAPLPDEFEPWLTRGDLGAAIVDDGPALARALARALERRWGLGRGDAGPRATTAFRLVNEAGDALPRLAVDVYGEHLVAHLYEEAGFWTAERRDRVLDALAQLGADGVYVKVRPKQANTLVDTRREDLAPRAQVRGRAAPDELSILEEGIGYLARLGDGLSTGIFLDQRGNRRRVRDMARDKSVANLFAYTCAFAVAAAKGGATRTVNVDASAAALERGRANLVHAGVLPEGNHTLVVEDVFAWIARAKAKRERFDLVILDPPSFSTTKHTTFAAESDYGKVAALALALVAPGGALLACSNHRKLSRAKLRRMLHDAARSAHREVAQLKDLADPVDFPAPLGHEPQLKSALMTLAR